MPTLCMGFPNTKPSRKLLILYWKQLFERNGIQSSHFGTYSQRPPFIVQLQNPQEFKFEITGPVFEGFAQRSIP
jgi:hypothetical protein